MSTANRPPAPRTVPAQLAVRADADPERVAIETHGVGGLTFARWHRDALTLAGGLRARGVRRGDRVVLRFGARHWTDFAVAYCGVLAAGAVAVPCSDRLPPAELRYVVGHCAAVGVLHASDPVDTGVWQCGVGDLTAGGTTGAVTGAPADLEPPEPTDLAQILYTSGTTGRPKGVAATHANLTAGATGDPRRRPMTHSMHFLHAFPIGTNAAQTMLRHALDAHPAALTLPEFTPMRFARLVESRRVGTVFLVPSMAIELLASGVLDRFDTSSVLLIGSTAAALPPAVATALVAAFPRATVVNSYTSTEAAPAHTTMVFDPRRPGSVGRPSGGSLRITDPDGRPVPRGQTGEVWLRSPHSRAYYGDASASREVFHDGWVRMGDLGRLDADGHLYLVDRHQDVIKTGAYKVSTLQVEAAIHEHPAVREVAVVGVPHPVLGTVVAAALVLRDPLDLPALRGFLKDRLAGHELPARMVTVDALPRNAGGKVLKRQLAATILGDGA
ncbi:class I adenylate-forming enzyme family protein [Virgisporangium ochraceum]|uniref:Long-chain-fatty-acid--CoA ligase n=1 Tax=Virgisporangium ochraceum TaxID=65505 RepID=A0A8J4ED77_9ACTN|nr:class I adenylate-forming enzyme family protein [Virgisporangium ochraceum]GIJ70419.1 long-chain-fatty-acid--CoA ligase [Virgisporangium ochraceum]